jgi:hypothetical protein
MRRYCQLPNNDTNGGGTECLGSEASNGVVILSAPTGTIPLSPSQNLHALPSYQTLTSTVSSQTWSKGQVQKTKCICRALFSIVFAINHSIYRTRSFVGMFIKSVIESSPVSAKRNRHIQSLFVSRFILTTFSHLRITVE